MSTAANEGRPDDTMHRRAPSRPRTSPLSPESLPGDSVDLVQLWNTLRDNLSTVLVVAGLLFGAVMALTLSAPMEFESTGRLYLGELDREGSAGASGTSELDLSGAKLGDVASEIEILRSRTLVMRAILASGHNVSIAPIGWQPPRFWRWMAIPASCAGISRPPITTFTTGI